ncbi:MAG: hypothetical protein INH43_17530 [Acidobacteriaceae bacterium]|nr:hypothetical protein [Acidobacteriaceae bacterium]
MILNGAGDRVRTGDVQLGKLGDVLVLAGDLGEARRRYAASLGIDEKLAEENPASAAARRDVIVSLAKLGQMAGSGSIGSGRWRWRRRSRRRGGWPPGISGCWGTWRTGPAAERAGGAEGGWGRAMRAWIARWRPGG